MPHLLIVDDDAAIRETLAEVGRDCGFSVALAASVKDALIQLERQAPDLVLTDVRLPEGSGMDIFKNAAAASAEVVIMTGHGTMDNAVQALRLGATDYLVKPICMERLNDILARIAARAGTESPGAPFEEPGRFGRMYGASERMLELYRQLKRVAPTNVTALVIGESGTGKELAAHAIHELSPRRQRPFIAVNCGAISPNLIESEMFGHERGSFTGADRQHKGYFERADGGTLFLDEVTEMPLDLQVKLLRVLETGQFMRVGTNREIACDIRIIAATNRNPEQAVRDGKLREDLYYRLSVFPVELPPLRERGEDILFLARGFLEVQNQESGKRKDFSDRALTVLKQYDWPGNVRELKNFVRRAFIMADGDTLEADRLVPQVSPSSPGGDGQVSVPVGETLAEADRRLILATLERCNGVKKQTAAMLGISPKTLYNRLEEYAAAGYELPGESGSRTDPPPGNQGGAHLP
ncbi:MAG: sigma-54-dependent transcriptional regulator [Achromobacter sp.]|uniref:sigma-54-dependent transcriptional regulator n=1 Tax=Achromobacter sp. TaxID=134375 RepID=UPI003D07EA15